MSVSISYFFNHDADLAATAELINSTLGSLLKPSIGNPENCFTTRFMGMEFDLGLTADYVDDRELDFSNFQFELGFTTYWGGAGARPIQLAALLSVIYILHWHLGIVGMLVYDVQRLLARYTEQEIEGYGKRLYDVLSADAFISFPAHLAAIRQRLPEEWQRLYQATACYGTGLDLAFVSIYCASFFGYWLNRRESGLLTRFYGSLRCL